MAIIWNQPPAPDSSPIETPEEMKERVEVSMDEAEEDEDDLAITKEIDEARSFVEFKGFGH